MEPIQRGSCDGILSELVENHRDIAVPSSILAPALPVEDSSEYCMHTRVLVIKASILQEWLSIGKIRRPTHLL